MAKFCVQCGNEIPEGNNVCTNCGTPVNGAPAAQVQPAPASTTVVVNQAQAQQKQSNGMAIAGFVVSLVSTLLCCGSFNVISLILSIVGVVKAKDCGGAGKGLGIAGIIISAIGIVIVILLTVLGYAAAILEEAGYSY